MGLLTSDEHSARSCRSRFTRYAQTPAAPLALTYARVVVVLAGRSRCCSTGCSARRCRRCSRGSGLVALIRLNAESKDHYKLNDLEHASRSSSPAPSCDQTVGDSRSLADRGHRLGVRRSASSHRALTQRGHFVASSRRRRRASSIAALDHEPVVGARLRARRRARSRRAAPSARAASRPRRRRRSPPRRSWRRPRVRARRRRPPRGLLSARATGRRRATNTARSRPSRTFSRSLRGGDRRAAAMFVDAPRGSRRPGVDAVELAERERGRLGDAGGRARERDRDRGRARAHVVGHLGEERERRGRDERGRELRLRERVHRDDARRRGREPSAAASARHGAGRAPLARRGHRVRAEQPVRGRALDAGPRSASPRARATRARAGEVRAARRRAGRERRLRDVGRGACAPPAAPRRRGRTRRASPTTARAPTRRGTRGCPRRRARCGRPAARSRARRRRRTRGTPRPRRARPRRPRPRRAARACGSASARRAAAGRARRRRAATRPSPRYT